MARVRHTTAHRQRGGELVRVQRRFHSEHAAALYHLREWGEHAHPGHELLGRHGDSLIEYVEDVPEGAGGPEFRVTLPSGAIVTCIDADSAREHILRNGGIVLAEGEPPPERVSSEE